MPNNRRSESESKATEGSIGTVDRLAQPEGADEEKKGGQAWSELDACEPPEAPVRAVISASLETW